MAAWLVVATLVAVLIGRVIARRERQVPGADRVPSSVDLPKQRSASDLAALLRLGRRR